MKEKYGSDYSESGSSDADDSEDSEDTEEDSDGEELTPAVDAAILRTLARIRKRDPAIYEGGRRVFEGVFDFARGASPWTPRGLIFGLGIHPYMQRNRRERRARRQPRSQRGKKRFARSIHDYEGSLY